MAVVSPARGRHFRLFRLPDEILETLKGYFQLRALYSIFFLHPIHPLYTFVYVDIWALEPSLKYLLYLIVWIKYIKFSPTLLLRGESPSLD